jgi:hypothetical protein
MTTILLILVTLYIAVMLVFGFITLIRTIFMKTDFEKEQEKLWKNKLEDLQKEIKNEK